MKKKLEIQLSKLKQLEEFDLDLEQYTTDSSQASEILLWAYNNRDIENKIIADFGCGNGILGIGALLLNAKKVYFIDNDKKAIKITKENTKTGEFILDDISNFSKPIDTVIMNPPFGVRNRKADKIFLETAMKYSKSIYSIHKIESKDFINKLCKENNFKVETIKEFKILLKKTQKFHKKERYYVHVGCWYLKL